MSPSDFHTAHLGCTVKWSVKVSWLRHMDEHDASYVIQENLYLQGNMNIRHKTTCT